MITQSPKDIDHTGKEYTQIHCDHCNGDGPQVWSLEEWAKGAALKLAIDKGWAVRWVKVYCDKCVKGGK